MISLLVLRDIFITYTNVRNFLLKLVDSNPSKERKKMIQQWKIYAFASALFAGLTAVLAKQGVKNIPSNYATLIRTIVIVFFSGIISLVSP